MPDSDRDRPRETERDASSLSDPRGADVNRPVVPVLFVPVLFVTGLTPKELSERLPPGADILRKPFSAAELYLAVRPEARPTPAESPIPVFVVPTTTEPSTTEPDTTVTTTLPSATTVPANTVPPTENLSGEPPSTSLVPGSFVRRPPDAACAGWPRWSGAGVPTFQRVASSLLCT